MASDLDCDVLVVGSGAGGLTAALTASVAGLDVLLIEKDERFGGTTAHSEGMIWIPGNHHAERVGKHDRPDEALTYLQAVAGNHLDRAKSLAYVNAAADMLRFVEAQSAVRYALAGSIDYHSEQPGATVGTRSLRVEPMDGRTLGPIFEWIRPPLKSTLAFGGMTLTSLDLADAFNAHRSAKSFLRMARMTARFGLDRLRGYSRGTRIGNGHAVVASLVKALHERRARMMRGTRLQRLVINDGRVSGAVVATPTGESTIKARLAVVLASGGFSGDQGRKSVTYPPVGPKTPAALLASETNTGDGLRAAVEIGGSFNSALAQPAAWAPASLVPQRNGSTVAYPHFIDRNKPGFILVDWNGLRFVNESANYHRLVPAMIEHCRHRPQTSAWLIADARAVDRYGIGALPPFPLLLRQGVKSGYLKKANSIEALAAAIDVPAGQLEQTITRFNGFAQSGSDLDFERGGTAYECACGDPAVAPNPALGELSKPPYYAVEIVPSDIGTFAGLKTDAAARVLGSDRTPIAGLYAVGNDAASAFGGTYPAAGITIGLAMTFGYLAARDVIAAKKPDDVRSAA